MTSLLLQDEVAPLREEVQHQVYKKALLGTTGA
ncbi:MAG: hypothetical protein JCHSAcid_16480 [uncultured Acidilobus sp. JCHS]|jgi:hypothetical protein|nr:MAG: hypothetical protein JCHSAcid_16480 [uncultured Acidilobus sp. JCHS]